MSRSFALRVSSGSVFKFGLACTISRNCAIAASITRGSLAPKLLDHACDVKSRYSRPWSSHTSEPRARTSVILFLSPSTGSWIKDRLPRSAATSNRSVLVALLFIGRYHSLDYLAHHWPPDLWQQELLAE